MKTVLIIDDDLLIIDIAKDILKDGGYNILTARCAKDGLNTLEKKPVDIVLLDIVMPDESGLEILPKIKALASPPVVIVMTGMASLDSSIEAIRGGAYDYIVKPLQPEELLCSIEKAFEHQNLFDKNVALMSKLRGRVKELELFEKTSKAISGTFVLDELLENIMGLTKDLFQAETCSILLLDDTTNELVFTVALGKKGEQVKECRIKSGEGIAGWVAEKEEPLLIPDANEDKRFCHDVDDKTGFVTKSLIAVPLSIKAKTIGVIEVINKTNDGTFNETDMNTLITVANQIAIAIDNATMTADLKRSNVRIEGYSKNLELMVRERTMELETANMELKEVHAQVVQTEKLSSIGYLAAGIAHEINNPIGFVSSNIRTLGEYVEDILCLLKGYEAVTHEARINGYPLALNKIEKIKESMQFDFVREDIGKLIAESKDGADRVHQIVQDLKNFARADNAKRSFVDIHSSLDSTLNIVWNELKYKAEIVKDYGDLPMVKCLPMKLNQVFMNILINAAQSIKENGAITIRTYAERKMVIIKISDTGEGIEGKTMNKIFDPFFTTKEPGKGTGLGLSVSYNIIKEHNGEIDVKSTIGKGTTFTISIPVSVGASETPQAQDKDEALAV